MKNIKTLFILGFLLLSNSLFAQLQLTPYLASEQLEAAKTKVMEKFSDPQLISVATVNGTLPGLELGGTPIPITFTFDNSDGKGKSSGWVYVFRSTAAPENIQAVVVAVTAIMGTLSFNLSDMGVPLGFITNYVSANNLDGKAWINSNNMVDRLLAAPAYQSFLATYPTAVPKYINLGYANYPPLDANTPYWAIQVNSATDSTIIIINAITGDVTDVEENVVNISTIKNYPNPAVDIVTFEIPNKLIADETTIKVFDYSGKLLLTQLQLLSDKYSLSTKELSNGNYIITFENGINKGTSSFIISK